MFHLQPARTVNLWPSSDGWARPVPLRQPLRSCLEKVCKALLRGDLQGAWSLATSWVQVEVQLPSRPAQTVGIDLYIIQQAGQPVPEVMCWPQQCDGCHKSKWGFKREVRLVAAGGGLGGEGAAMLGPECPHV